MICLRRFEPKEDDIIVTAVEPTQDAGENLVILELDEVPLEGPWSPDPVIDRHLAKRRRENLLRAQRQQVRELVEARRRLYPPWWVRLWRSIFRKRTCLTKTE